MNTLKSKIEGSIFGFAVGDAMGATTEFMSESEIKERYGKVESIIGGGWLSLKAGQVTDDTQMTMCVMKALMDCRFTDDDNVPEICEFEKKCKKNFISWKKSGPQDIGSQCFKAICAMENGTEIDRNENGLGNGGLMRAMPCAIIEQPVLNLIQNNLTHPSSTCGSKVLEYTGLIYRCLYDKPFEETNILLKEPTGCVVNTINNAKYWLYNTSDFSEAIIGAVNHGGDADTIAAITGSLVGAKYGVQSIPSNWIDALDSNTKKFLKKFCEFAFSYLQSHEFVI